MPPTFVCPLCVLHPHTFVYPLGVYTHPSCTYTPLCICMFSEASACCGGCKGPLTCWTPPPVWGCLPLGLHPHSFIGFPVHQYVLGISVCDMGNISLMLEFWGSVPPSVWGFGGISTWGVHMLILVHSCSSLCLMFLLWL